MGKNGGWEVPSSLIDPRHLGHLVSSLSGIIYEVPTSKDIYFAGNLHRPRKLESPVILTRIATRITIGFCQGWILE